MVVCKFFQQGSCRYGQNCRFDHIYSSKYSYHANAPPEPITAVPGLTDDQLLNQVHAELQSMIRGGQWLLSGYAPFKEKASFPGLLDMSPEEARLIIYEARANNTLDQAVAFMNNITQEAKQKYELLLTKNSNITKILRSLYNGENVAAPFGNLSRSNTSYGNSNASSIFRSAVQPTSSSVFSQNNPSSVFGNNAFASPDPAQSIFAQASQNVFQNQNLTPSIFGVPSQDASSQQQSVFSQADPAQSMFAQATQNAFAHNTEPTPNVFNLQNAQNTAASIFASASQSVFAPPQQTTFNNPAGGDPPTNVFQKPGNQSQSNQNGFGVQNVFNQQAVDTGVYSKIEDVSPEDMEAFKADDFKMGFVPEIPPPQSLCT